jgi:signal transduction histidine kinase
MGPVSKSLGEQNQEFDVTLTVKETGKGIGSEHSQNDLFTPFMQEDPLASGSGLGLSIVRQAVNFLGGSIEINSTRGVGTELTIRTPLTRFLVHQTPRHLTRYSTPCRLLLRGRRLVS